MHLLPIFSALVGLANAHYMVANITIDGVNQGPGTCMRVPPNTNPMININSPQMACNVGGEKQVDFTCAAKAGSKITAQWRTWPDGSQDTPLDPSHQGPCSVYMKLMGPNGSGSVNGVGWFKIYEEGYSNGAWCSQRIAKNGNKMSFTIPPDLKGGYYTLRMDHLALHEAQAIGGAQWYIGCAQLYVFSTGGKALPTSTVSIPGHLVKNHPGMLYNYWAPGNDKPTNYQIPGPRPYKAQAGVGGGKAIMTAFNPHPKYNECLVKNANWCGVSLPGFQDEASCWAASEYCYHQETVCWKDAPATGNLGCWIWAKKCLQAQQYCTTCAPKCKGTFLNTKAKVQARRSMIWR